VPIPLGAVIAPLIAVYGVFITPIGWGWALVVWGYALVWLLFNDQVAVVATKVFDRLTKKSRVAHPGTAVERR